MCLDNLLARHNVLGKIAIWSESVHDIRSDVWAKNCEFAAIIGFVSDALCLGGGQVLNGHAGIGEQASEFELGTWIRKERSGCVAINVGKLTNQNPASV